MQERKGEERIVARSMLTPTNLAFTVSTSSSTVQNPIASRSPVIRRAPCQNDWTSTGIPGAREHNQDAGSSSQVWQEDAVQDVSTRRLVATEEEAQERLNLTEDLKSSRRLVASGNSETEGKDKNWPHSLSTCTGCVPHMEKVFNCETRYGLSPTDNMKREHPPTIKANEARSTRRLVARSTRRLVAVTLITEYKIYFTQQSRKKTLIERKW